MKTSPLISVGMPIKNGMPFLKESLQNIIEQTYSNIEIIISNNCSTDKTQEYLSKVNFKDRKIKIFNQKKQLSALANFDFVKRKSKGKYFIWCAHDDLRDKCQFQILVDNLEKNKKTILCFSDVYTSEKFIKNYKNIKFDFQTQNYNILQRLSKTSIQKCYHFYGMWKLKHLEKIPMYYNPGW